MKKSLEDKLRMAQTWASGLGGGTIPKEWRYPEQMELRHHGERRTPAEISEIVLRDPGVRDILFFIHGLMYDETCWQAPDFNMTEAFEDDFGIFPVHIRYDTGRHISDNGLDLANLLEELFQSVEDTCGSWHIVAHSMGGLVIHSALHQAEKTGMDFTKKVDKVFLLAVPHQGAPLEKAVQLVRLALKAAPYLPFRYTGLGLKRLFQSIPVGEKETLAPVGEVVDFFVRRVPTLAIKLAAGILDLRSEGILDLRHGYMLQEEWEQAEAWGGMIPRKAPVPPLPGARYYALTGSLSEKSSGDPSPFVNDGMVSTASAANIGRDDELRFLENDRYRHLPGVNHFGMALNPDVYRALAEWFSEE
ncbi:esterase/lipase family protein [Thermodesulfobacteriota bacterium]